MYPCQAKGIRTCLNSKSIHNSTTKVPECSSNLPICLMLPEYISLMYVTAGTWKRSFEIMDNLLVTSPDQFTYLAKQPGFNSLSAQSVSFFLKVNEECRPCQFSKQIY